MPTIADDDLYPPEDPTYHGQHLAAGQAGTTTVGPNAQGYTTPYSAPTGTTASQDPNGPVAGDSGSRFVNFTQYLNANKDSAAAQAQALARSVSAHGQAAQTDLAGAQQKFSAGVQAGSGSGNAVQGGPTAKSKAGQVPGAQTGGGGKYSVLPSALASSPGSGSAPVMNTGLTPPATPTSPSGAPLGKGQSALEGVPQRGSDPMTVSRAQADARAKESYTGPAGLYEQDPTGFSGLMGRTQQAQDEAQALGSGTGLQGLMHARSGGTAGQNRFDAGLMGATGGQAFQDLAQRYGKLNDALNGAQSRSVQNADEARATTQSNANSWGNLVNQQDAAQGESQHAAADQTAKQKADRVAAEAWANANDPEQTVENTVGNNAMDIFRSYGIDPTEHAVGDVASAGKNPNAALFSKASDAELAQYHGLTDTQAKRNYLAVLRRKYGV